VNRAKQAVLIVDPVQRGGREHEVDGLRGLEFEQVGGDEVTFESRLARDRAIIASEASTPITRPRGRRSANSLVTRPVPHPASIAVSSPRSETLARNSRPDSSCMSEIRSYAPASQSMAVIASAAR
jgi:hypothetical protein